MGKSKISLLAKAFAVALLLGLLLLVFKSSGPYMCASLYSAAYFVLTWILLDENRKGCNIDSEWVLLAIAVGRVAADLPVRYFNWYADFWTIMVPLFSVVAVVLAWCSWHTRKVSTIALSAIILILLNVSLHTLWVDYLANQDIAKIIFI